MLDVCSPDPCSPMLALARLSQVSGSLSRRMSRVDSTVITDPDRISHVDTLTE